MTDESVVIPNVPKVDGNFQPKGSPTGGTQIQPKATSSANVSLLPDTDAHCIRSW